MKLDLYSQSGTEIVTEVGEILRLPAGDLSLEVQCSLIQRMDASDVIVVDKVVRLDSTAYVARTHVCASRLLSALATASPCVSNAVLEERHGVRLQQLSSLLSDAHIFVDGREDVLFAFQRFRGADSTLYRLRQKYYSAELALFADCRESTKLRCILGRLRSDVDMQAVGSKDEIDSKEHLWFKVPTALLLWSHDLVRHEEEGHEYWVDNGLPLLPRFRKVV